MPLRRFDFSGQGGGLVADSNEFTLAPNEWSDCRNVRFHNRTISRMSGEESLYSTGLLPSSFGTLSGSGLRNLQFLNGQAGNDYYYWTDHNGLVFRTNAAESTASVTPTTALRTSQTVTISRATNAVITFSAAPNATVRVGSVIIVTGVSGQTSLNRGYVVTAVNGNSFTTNADTSLVGSGAVFTNIALTLQERVEANNPIQMNVASGGNVLIVNDGDRTPRYINSASPGTDSNLLTDLPGWNYVSGETSTADVIRSFKYVMVAGGLATTTTATGSITYKPGTVRVSNRAAPGALPTWDPNATGADTADEFELAEGGEIVDMVSLGDTLCVFTDDSIYGLRVGNTNVTSTKLLQGRGMLSQNCGVEFFGKLFVVGNEDIYLFQGGAATQSVADERVRDYFFDNINSAYYDDTFVVHNEREDEIWVCYTTSDATSRGCDEALIWNYNHNTWTKRDLPGVFFGVLGPTISSNAFNYSNYKLHTSSSDLYRIYTMDEGDTMAVRGVSAVGSRVYTAFVERLGLDLSPDSPGISKWISSIDFKLVGEGQVEVAIQASNSPNDTIQLDTQLPRNAMKRTFHMENDGDLMISPNTNGKFINIRISGEDDWELVDYVVDFKPTERRTRGG